MTNQGISQGSRLRLGGGLAGLIAVLVAGYLAPERLGDMARESVWLDNEHQRLAFATDAEVKRWQKQVAASTGARDSNRAAVETTLGHGWQHSSSGRATGSVRFTRREIHQKDWPSILTALHRLETMAGLSIERVTVTAKGGRKRLLRVDIVVRLENAEPVAFSGRLPVLGRKESGSLAASRGWPCARPRPVLVATPTIRFSGLGFS